MKYFLLFLFSFASLFAQAPLKLVLVNASTGKDLQALGSSETIALLVVGASLSIRAESEAPIGSVGFKLNGKLHQTENVSPYYFTGDSNGKPNIWKPALGEYTVEAISYSGPNRTGTAGPPTTSKITVIKSLPTGGEPAPVPLPLNYVSPTIRWPSGMGGGAWPHRVDPFTLGKPSSDMGDYWSDSGHVVYDPDGSISEDPGLGAIATYAYARGVIATQPRWDPPAYRGGKPNPDPSVRINSYITTNGGPLKGALTQARSTNTTGNCSFVLWGNGLLTAAASQTGHGNVPWPVLKLPDSKKVHDLAITSNNELALIACYDTEQDKGQIAVIMVEGRGLPSHTFAQMGLFNQASLSDFKLLGYVDLPIKGPFKISAASNGHWNGPSETNGLSLGQISLTNPSNLTNLTTGAWQKTISKNGYAVVTSQTENKAVVVDLTPVFTYITQSWLSSVDSFNKTTAARQAKTWPATFEEEPSITPQINSQFDVTAPVSVLCGHSLDRWSKDRYKFHVGQEDGHLVIFDASHLMARFTYQIKSPAIKEMGRFFVGKSPVGLAVARYNDGLNNPIFLPLTGRRGDGQNNVLWIACNTDRKVVEVLTFEGKGTVLRTLQDQRMQEPVDVAVAQRGYIVLVCDYAGKQLVGWRIGNITNHRVTPPVTFTPGQPEGYEISGFHPIPGKPRKVSSGNVN